MARKLHAHESRSAVEVLPADAGDAGNASPSPMEGVAAIWLGLPWFNLWMQAWSPWLEQYGDAFAARQDSSDNADDRRQAAMPWIPQIAATVVPLRRRDDLPGAEASKVSLRVRVPTLPWQTGTASVIAFDTLTPRPAPSSVEVRPGGR